MALSKQAFQPSCPGSFTSSGTHIPIQMSDEKYTDTCYILKAYYFSTWNLHLQSLNVCCFLFYERSVVLLMSTHLLFSPNCPFRSARTAPNPLTWYFVQTKHTDTDTCANTNNFKPHRYEPITETFVCDLTARQWSERRQNNIIIMPPCKKPEFMLHRFCPRDDK